MATIILHPTHFSKVQLDQCLEAGWRATGQSVYNTSYLLLDSGEVIDVLPLRLDLQEHCFSKRLRKRMRKNLDRFRVEYGPASDITDEKADVNTLYMEENPNKSLVHIEYHIWGNYWRKVLDTWETRVYDGNELIAFSFFDLGDKTAYSKAGIYNPDYADHSLGLFTMALEIEFCKRVGKTHYYPGYASDTLPLFDYKHRLGQMEFFDIRSQQWLIHGQHPSVQQPIKVVHQKLQELTELLQQAAHYCKLFVYPYMDLRYRTEGHSAYLDAPMLVYLEQQSARTYLVATYDFAADEYYLIRTEVPTYMEDRRIGYGLYGVPYFADPLRVRSIWARFSTAKEIVAFLASAH